MSEIDLLRRIWSEIETVNVHLAEIANANANNIKQLEEMICKKLENVKEITKEIDSGHCCGPANDQKIEMNKWKKLKKNKYPYDSYNEFYIVTDGKEVWVAWSERNEIYFISKTTENESMIADRLTHWCDLENIELPKG